MHGPIAGKGRGGWVGPGRTTGLRVLNLGVWRLVRRPGAPDADSPIVRGGQQPRPCLHPTDRVHAGAVAHEDVQQGPVVPVPYVHLRILGAAHHELFPRPGEATADDEAALVVSDITVEHTPGADVPQMDGGTLLRAGDLLGDVDQKFVPEGRGANRRDGVSFKQRRQVALCEHIEHLDASIMDGEHPGAVACDGEILHVAGGVPPADLLVGIRAPQVDAAVEAGRDEARRVAEPTHARHRAHVLAESSRWDGLANCSAGTRLAAARDAACVGGFGGVARGRECGQLPQANAPVARRGQEELVVGAECHLDARLRMAG
mmetsp:Transcript_13928/g.39795  ORF Transcript_13928/g.39795 Transcript_13928/m.39795 type:complete len:318 (-) Transcript_13928:933-1886(-)